MSQTRFHRGKALSSLSSSSGRSPRTGTPLGGRKSRSIYQLGAVPPGKRIATHTLRHSAARHWLASGIPINVVSRWLGHATLQTTLIYLEVLPDPLGDIERVP